MKKIVSKMSSYFIVKLLNLLDRQNRISLKRNSFIHPSVKMRGSKVLGSIRIGEGCKINEVRINAESTVSIGRYTSLNGPNTDIISKINPVNIGSFCSIARSVSIQEFNHKYQGLTTYHIHQNIFNEGRLKDIYSNGGIEIGNDVWIGAHCVITGGSTIGHGAVIAANSVVVGNIPPFSIAGGSPAKVIKYRFDQQKITEILDLAWWDWDLEKIKQNKDLFQ